MSLVVQYCQSLPSHCAVWEFAHWLEEWERSQWRALGWMVANCMFSSSVRLTLTPGPSFGIGSWRPGGGWQAIIHQSEACRLAWIILQAAGDYCCPLQGWICAQMLWWHCANFISHHPNFIWWLWRTVSCFSVINTRFEYLTHIFNRCVMALIRGIHSKFPCPICLIPSKNLTDHSTDYALQMVEDAKAHLELYRQNHDAGEKVLKEQSLWPVDVSLHSDINIILLTWIIPMTTIRTLFGWSISPNLSILYRLICCMQVTLAYGATICSRSWSPI